LILVLFHCFYFRYYHRSYGSSLLFDFTPGLQHLFHKFFPSQQWLNYSKVGGGTLNSGVNVELVPVVKFSRNGPERRLKVVERQLEVPERRSGRNGVPALSG